MPDPNKSLLERLTDFLTPQPTSPAERRQELIETLREAQSEGLIDADALSMIEGVFQVGQLCARDILVPRAQIDWIDINLSLPEIIKSVISAAHSRFPVFEGMSRKSRYKDLELDSESTSRHGSRCSHVLVVWRPILVQVNAASILHHHNWGRRHSRAAFFAYRLKVLR